VSNAGPIRGSVLVVEDDESTAELERRALTRAGAKVVLVARVADALGLLARQPFAAVVLDYQLPDGDPWRVLDAAAERVPRVPVILATAMGNEQIAVEAIHRGVADYIKKDPVFWEHLPRVVERVTRLAGAEEQLRRERSRLAEAQRIAQLGSWEWDVLENRVTWSDELYRIFGRDRATFGASYEAFLECVLPAERELVDAGIRHSVESRTPFRHLYRVTSGGGQPRWVEGRGTVELDEEGNVLRMAGTAQDVTEREERQAQQLLAQQERERLNQRLQALNLELQGSLREREVMLQEIHHRVKNNLQVISSLINMQIRKLEAGENRDALEECKSRVQAIALIHEKLYRAGDYARVPFGDYASSLASSVFQAHRHVAANVKLELEIEELPLAVDQAIPCGLILNELITNALKHGFGDGRTGTVRVRLEQLDRDYVALTVSNDGLALPDAFEARNSRSLGLNLVTTLARQLQAHIEVSREPDTRFRLRFGRST
jgi:two-component system response regulator